MADNKYKKLYLKAYILLTVFVLTFFCGFSLFAIKITLYTPLTAIVCSAIVSIILFRDFAKLSALIVVQFADIDFTEDIPDNKIIRIKDYLKKKGRLNE